MASTPLGHRIRELGRQTVGLTRELWRHGQEIELLYRSLAFAALFFVTLVPLLVVIAAALPSRGNGIADWITDGLALSGRSARAVGDLFATRSEVLSATTALSLAALAVFGISLMSALQRSYERIWQLSAGPWHTVWRQVVGLAALIAYILLTTWRGVLPHHATATTALRAAVSVLGGVLYFWWLQHLLLGGRVAWRTLLPGAIATVVAFAGLRVFSQLVFAPLIVSNAISYGTVGTVLVVQSWLIGVGYTVYAGAMVGPILHDRRGDEGGPDAD
ncbi:YhjD/YihY/BrkB family envelope integrity protein [Kitasatospora azatica]|uniref:YhjD/YihY/BrkB family envelope integrity protein n=1 Tax=Kitasatospora azatica TaxID=58347 RepID=UPI0005617B68|nr:YhjD/YihY/BrkB family envelope integrity protein [Kitasatospora azatica]